MKVIGVLILMRTSLCRILLSPVVCLGKGAHAKIFLSAVYDSVVSTWGQYRCDF